MLVRTGDGEGELRALRALAVLQGNFGRVSGRVKLLTLEVRDSRRGGWYDRGCGGWLCSVWRERAQVKLGKW